MLSELGYGLLALAKITVFWTLTTYPTFLLTTNIYTQKIILELFNNYESQLQVGGARTCMNNADLRCPNSPKDINVLKTSNQTIDLSSIDV
jgi:hypothetical protein